MKKISVKLLVVLLAAVSLLQAQQIISPDEIREGMKGFGYTVLHGEKVQRFDVEVVSVIKQFRSGKDAILVYVHGIGLEHTGIIAGMSGSPIYIEGKLAGALSFGWANSKDTLAGVTPIADMYELYDRMELDKSLAMNAPEVKLNFNQYGETVKEERLDNRRYDMRKGAYSPASTPLLFSGFNEDALSPYLQDFEDKGFTPLIGGGSIEDTNADISKLNGGDACGIALITGDINAFGIGTVTHSDDTNFLLFGHGMDQSGSIKAPVYKASVKTVVALNTLSFKLGVGIGEPLGYTTYDAKFAVAGKYGDSTGLMVPVNMKVKHSEVENEYSFEVIKNPNYFSSLLGAAMLSGISGTEGMGEEVTVKVSYSMHSSGFEKPIKVTNKILSFNSLEAFKISAQSIIYPIEALLYNRFKRTDVTNVDIDIDIMNELEYAVLEDLSLDRRVYRPGDELVVKAGIRPAGGERVYKSITLQIPETVKPGYYGVFCAPPAVLESFERKYFPKKYAINSAQDIYDVLNKSYDPDKLTVWLYVSTTGIVIRGSEFENLPSWMYGTLAAEPSTDKGPMYSLIKNSLNTGYYNIGSSSLQITILPKDQ